MQILEFGKKIEKKIEKESVIALGKFNGLHLGHQEVLRNAARHAKSKNLNLIIMIFTINREKPDYEWIFSLQTRLKLLAQYDPQYILLFEPTIKNFKTTEEEFYFFLKNHLNISTIFCGENFKIKDLQTISRMKEHFKVEVIELQKYKNQIISSTTIISMLKLGEVEDLNKLLGFPYFLFGTVVGGSKRGTKLGFPTANLLIEENIIIPKEGIYSTKVKIKNIIYDSVTSISTNPTFTNSSEIKVEVHIFNFNEIIYGEKIYLQFFDFIRKPIKFESIDDLISAIKNDIQHSQTFFKKMLK